MKQLRTMFQKIRERHMITTSEDGQTLLYIDRHIVHDGSFHTFNMLRNQGRKVRRPEQTFAIADQYVPSRGRASTGYPEEERRQVVATSTGTPGTLESLN